jgi:Bacteriophage CI repressor helix-turn-helix domain.
MLFCMNQAERIISKFGTQDALATAIDVHQSAVAAWKKRGFIPARQQQRVLAAAVAKGIDLKPEDFFAVSEPEQRAS